jgi:hypothetical protein
MRRPNRLPHQYCARSPSKAPLTPAITTVASWWGC